MVTNTQGNIKKTLLEIVGAYNQYLYSHFGIEYEISKETTNFNVNEIECETTYEYVNVGIENVNSLHSCFDVYKDKISTYNLIINRKLQDTESYDLEYILDEKGRIKVYNFDSVINFGKFKSKTILEIIKVEPNYITDCLLNLKHFATTTIVIMLICVFDSLINEIAILTNLFKLRLKVYQDDARRISKQIQREEKAGAEQWLNDGMREAFNDDPTNLWNID